MNAHSRSPFLAQSRSWSCCCSPPQAFAAPAKLQDPPELKALKYRLIGPAWGGRVSRVAGRAGRSRRLLRGDGLGRRLEVGRRRRRRGTRSSTTSRSPRSARSPSPPSDPNVVYVGSGEANIRGNVAAGNGIYKSTDAGKTWTHVWKQEGQIGTMVVHPKERGRRLRRRARATRSAPTPSAGVYRTRDGGKTLAAGAQEGRGHRRLGRRPRSLQPQHRLRRPLAGPAPALGDDERRPGQSASGSPATAATPGSSSRATGCRKGSGARWGSPWRRRTAGGSTR